MEIVQTAKDRKRTGTGEHAEYYTDDQKVILRRRTRLNWWIRVDGITEGAELTYFANDDRLLVNGAPRDPGNSRIARKQNSGRMSILETKEISKTYRGRRVVDDVTVHVEQGEVVGLLGPNGAGKTTSFYMIVGLISPDSGQIVVDGAGHHQPAHVPARAPRHQLSAAGGLGLPQADGGREPDGDSGDAAHARAASGASAWTG